MLKAPYRLASAFRRADCRDISFLAERPLCRKFGALPWTEISN